MKILISDQLEQSCIDILTSEGFTVDNRPGLSAGDLLKTIEAYDALLVRSATKVTAEVIAAGKNLRVIGRAGTGVDNIDARAATRRGIIVMNTPGGNTVSAAEHTVSMMLSLARNIPQAHMSLHAGEWDRKRFTGTEVTGKTVGVIGLGKIGREVAARCKGLAMNVIGYDPVLSPDATAKLDIEAVSLDELYRRSDIISVHTPLTPETKGLLSDATLAKCKKGVRVINCARGGIVDEAALLRALESGHVAGAALDVFEVEPPKGNPLLTHARVVATPHLGASTEEAQEKVAVQIAHQVADALKGRGYFGVVNASVMNQMLNEEVRPYVLLAERLGSLLYQVSKGKVRRVAVSASGNVLGGSLELLTAGLLRGILTHTQPEPVNIVNAPFLAQELGLVVDEQAVGGGGPNVLRARLESDQENHEVSGTVFEGLPPRLLSLDGFRFDLDPQGHLLIYSNVDRPGMLASTGAILAERGINIAGVSLGRLAVGGEALTIMNVDSPVPGDLLRRIEVLDGVSRVRVAIIE